MLNVAYSPCPNDTYIFHAFQAGIIPGCEKVEVTHLDIEQLNLQAPSLKYDLMKVSAATAFHLLEDYVILPVGAALGFGCGPKLVAKQPFDIKSLPEKSVLLPGERTSAHALLNFLLPPPKSKTFTSYEKIPELLNSYKADAGVIIHETRFILEKFKLCEIVDLGTLWEKKTGLPIPLGVLIAKRSLGKVRLDSIVVSLRKTLEIAKETPQLSKEYILKHAQEKEWDVIEKHIKLYVTEESEQLSPLGRESLEVFMKACGVKKQREEVLYECNIC